MSPVRLPPFTLQSPLGEGGMGVVWSGRHDGTGLPVAVKLLRDATPALRAAFRREVEAVAALDHPGIVMVFDHGLVPVEAAVESEGRVRAGEPYLVMELASGGSLDRHPPPAHWPAVRTVLLDTLDALGHAHARGVVHRDLKPGNLLRCGVGDLRPGLKLTDFGLAHLTEGPGQDTARRSGTPPYMAPEQLAGDSHSLGPWTDLYALGCLAWELVTGSPPFGRHGEPAELLERHLHARPPPLRPHLAAPPELEGWLLRLLQKDPSRRFRTAADAAWALLHLGHAAADPRPAGAGPPGTAPTLAPDAGSFPAPSFPPPSFPPPSFTAHTFAPTVLPSWDRTAAHTVPVVLPAALAEPTDTGPDPLPPAPPLPFPERWARREAPARHLLHGAGRGLFPLRRLPFVGREAERDALWAALRAVRETGEATLVLVHGAAGLGASRLVAQVAERAAELGAATTLRATHAAEPTPGDGLDGLLARSGPALAEGTDTADATLRLLARRTRERPVVLVLDDLDLGPPAMALVRQLLRRRSLVAVPVLVLATADDARRDGPGWPELEALLDLEGASRLPLGPLSRRNLAALTREMLDLDAGLAAALVERAAGSPGYAVALVGDWLARDLLVTGPAGFRLRPGTELTLPADLEAVWRQRLAPHLAALDAPRRAALALAALLGARVARAEWVAACVAAGVAADPAGPDRLARAGLAQAEEGGWRFPQAAVRELLLDEARRAPEWRTWQAACARAVPGEDRERRGLHRLAAGQVPAALHDLLAATEDRVDRNEYARARWLIERVEAALAGAPPGDPRRGRLRLQRLLLAANTWQLQAAVDEGQALVRDAEAHGWPVLGAAWRVLGQARFRMGDLAGARSALEQALAHPEHGPAHLVRSALGNVAQAEGDLDQAERWYAAARAALGADPAPFDLARTLNDLGEVARLRGDLASAARHYQRAAALCRQVGARDANTSEVNLAMVRQQQGRHAEARDLLEGVLRESREGLVMLPLGASLALLHLSAAVLEDDVLWDRVHGAAGRTLRRLGLWDRDLARTLEAAGELLAARDLDRAEPTLGLAEESWAKLGEAEAAARVAARRAELRARMAR